MPAIRQKRNLYFLLVVVSGGLAIYLSLTKINCIAIVLWGLNLFSLLILFRQLRLLKSARLIWDSRILVTPTASFSQSKPNVKIHVEELVFSTFGLICGGQVYEWGRRGLKGDRLRTIIIDQQNIRLSFGNEKKLITVEFKHFLGDWESIEGLKKKLWDETGISATLEGQAR